MALSVEVAEVARVQPAVAKDARCLLGSVQVAQHDLRALDADLARLHRRERVATLHVNHLERRAWQRPAHCTGDDGRGQRRESRLAQLCHPPPLSDRYAELGGKRSLHHRIKRRRASDDPLESREVMLGGHRVFGEEE